MERKKQKAEEANSNAMEDDAFGTKKRMAMLDLLLEAESKGEIDLEGIREEVNTFMFEVGAHFTGGSVFGCGWILSPYFYCKTAPRCCVPTYSIS